MTYKSLSAGKQLELMKYILSKWVLTQWGNDGYTLELRLYPTDRYVSHTDKDYAQALIGFVTKLSKHVSDEVRQEIERILQ